MLIMKHHAVIVNLFVLGLLNASAQERHEAADRQKNLSTMLAEIA
jgi:hypothetical protein